MKWKLLCEGLENPAGIDTPTPELSWYGPEEGIGQTACRIRLWKKGIPSWDSGWLDTADSRYQLSADLEEKCGYSWQVTVKKEWDRSGADSRAVLYIDGERSTGAAAEALYSR